MNGAQYFRSWQWLREALLGIQSFISVFACESQYNLSWSRRCLSAASSLGSISISSSHLLLFLPFGLLLSLYPTEVLYTFIMSPFCATSSILLDLVFVKIFSKKYKLGNIYPLSWYFPLLGPHTRIILRILCTKTLNPYSPFRLHDKLIQSLDSHRGWRIVDGV